MSKRMTDEERKFIISSIEDAEFVCDGEEGKFKCGDGSQSRICGECEIYQKWESRKLSILERRDLIVFQIPRRWTAKQVLKFDADRKAFLQAHPKQKEAVK